MSAYATHHRKKTTRRRKTKSGKRTGGNLLRLIAPALTGIVGAGMKRRGRGSLGSRRQRRSIPGYGVRKGAGFKSFMKKAYRLGKKGIKSFHDSQLGKQVERTLLDKALGAAGKRIKSDLGRTALNIGGEEVKKLINKRL